MDIDAPVLAGAVAAQGVATGMGVPVAMPARLLRLSEWKGQALANAPLFSSEAATSVETRRCGFSRTLSE